MRRLAFRPASLRAVPSRRMTPVSGSKNWVIIRIVVDFPAPLGPRKPTTWPRSMVKLTPSTAGTPLKRLETRSSESSDIGSRLGVLPGRDTNARLGRRSTGRRPAAARRNEMSGGSGSSQGVSPGTEPRASAAHTRPPMPRFSALRRSLHDTFGHPDLRPGQAEVIRSVLAGHDTLAIMPTGAGKSLCYQLPALHLVGTTIVVSPLIALMKDQADALREKGIEVASINSTLPDREVREAEAGIAEKSKEFVFTTPERLADPAFRALL